MQKVKTQRLVINIGATKQTPRGVVCVEAHDADAVVCAFWEPMPWVVEADHTLEVCFVSHSRSVSYRCCLPFSCFLQFSCDLICVLLHLKPICLMFPLHLQHFLLRLQQRCLAFLALPQKLGFQPEVHCLSHDQQLGLSFISASLLCTKLAELLLGTGQGVRNFVERRKFLLP